LGVRGDQGRYRMVKGGSGGLRDVMGTTENVDHTHPEGVSAYGWPKASSTTEFVYPTNPE